MKDKSTLESFIIENREAFDDLKAPSHIWEKIQRDPAPMVSSIWKWWAIAASVLTLISMGYILGIKSQSHPDIAGWDEYLKTEAYYTTRINQKMDQIMTLDVSTEVMADIKLLDDVYHDLKTQLMEDPNADAQLLLSAMIKHQQQKLAVMEEILIRVDKYKKQDGNINEM